ncbi:efflux RND transporter periplasmic adaptor subunit [Aliiroseovarius sp.]|uniref:efflux RND transporter periplasmic adaptor subunit n=1 Tax=Aliiroseovarius sp. TaxID=1872442 RepID=UPI003BABA823
MAQAQDVVRPAKVAMAETTASSQTWTYPAIVLPSQEASVSFRVSGQVIDLPVRAAAGLKTGDVIAKLDPRDYEAQVAQLESQRDQAVAQLEALRSGARDEEVRALEAAVESARVQVELAQDEADRARTLVDRNVAAPVVLEQAEAQLRVAEATLKSQEEQLAIGVAGGREEEITGAEAALRGIETQLQAARDSLADTTLTAPFDGIVARRNVEAFTQVQAGQDIILLQNIATLHLAFDVPGADVPNISRSPDLQVMAIFPGSDAEHEAEFVEFSTQAEAATQTYRGRVSITAPADRTVLPGMVGQIVVRAPQTDAQEVHVPLSAIGADPNGAPFVWIVGTDNRVTKRAIETGPVAGDRVTIASGLAAGETVVSGGVSRLQEGMEIRPITKVGG